MLDSVDIAFPPGVAAVGGEEAPRLAERKLKPGGGLAGTPTTGKDFGDHVQALLFSNGQGHLLAHEVAFSLNH
jgi:hypothetical protein